MKIPTTFPLYEWQIGDLCYSRFHKGIRKIVDILDDKKSVYISGYTNSVRCHIIANKLLPVTLPIGTKVSIHLSDCVCTDKKCDHTVIGYLDKTHTVDANCMLHPLYVKYDPANNKFCILPVEYPKREIVKHVDKYDRLRMLFEEK